MRPRPWSRDEAIERVRRDVWRYLTAYARSEDVTLVAAELLQLRIDEVRRLAQVHFVLSPEVGRLVDEMPLLARRLRTVTTNEHEVGDGRLRGAVRWGETFSRRAATGTQHLYVTAPARRAYATPENELLAFALDAIARIGRATGWHRPKARALAEDVVHRVGEAERWLQLSALAGLSRELPSPKALARVRTGRRRRDYAAALDVAALHRRFVRRLDRAAVLEAVQARAFVTLQDSVLLELCCAFETIAALEALGWTRGPAGLLRRGPIFHGRRGDATLDVYYDRLPGLLADGSRYCAIQGDHDIPGAQSRRPDLVLHERRPVGERWLLVEAKQRQDGSLPDAAREALRDLLSYRRDFAGLAGAGEPYGLAYVWGAELTPQADSEVMLCTPDTLEDALAAWAGPAAA